MQKSGLNQSVGTLFVTGLQSPEAVVECLYQAPSGRIGFVADGVGKTAINPLLVGAFAWDFRLPGLKFFEADAWSEDGNSFFDGLRHRKEPSWVITYLSQKDPASVPEILRSLSELPFIEDSGEIIKRVSSQNSLFTRVTVWDAQYRAKIFTLDKAGLAATLTRMAQVSGAKIKEVHESEMPEW